MKQMSVKQVERQRDEYREKGRYSKVNETWEFEVPVTALCKKCYKKLCGLPGKEAIKVAFSEAKQ